VIFGPVFESHDFEVGTNVTCEESAISPRTELPFQISFVRLNPKTEMGGFRSRTRIIPPVVLIWNYDRFDRVHKIVLNADLTMT